MMQVIPVIDIRSGVAVAAQRGDRARYRPLQTPLAASADPVAVARGLMSLFPFRTLYVADLDGIEGRAPDLATQHRIADAWPGDLWLDDGMTSVRNAEVGNPTTPSLPTRGEGCSGSPPAQQVPSPLWRGSGRGGSRDPLIKSQLLYRTTKSHVLGSESLTSRADYESVRKAAGPSAPLSLDFRGDDFIGPRELLDDAALWPDRVIVMTLARVGSGEGPDLARLWDIVARAQGRRIYAAGGVRNVGDLEALRDIGIAGALVATALHNGRISAPELDRLAC